MAGDAGRCVPIHIILGGLDMRIALTGNPNSGKTTMYNALTGRNEKVGNWAGVTVERKESPIKEIGRAHV